MPSESVDIKVSAIKCAGPTSTSSMRSSEALGDTTAIWDTSYSTGSRAFLSAGCLEGSFEVKGSEEDAAPAASWRLFATVLLCCCSPLLYGFSMNFTSPAQFAMEGRPKREDAAVLPPPHLAVFSSRQFTVFAGAINLGGAIGALAGSLAMDRIGRKNGLALSALPQVVAWSGTALTSSPALLTSLRVLAGLGIGLGTAIAPVYIGEASTPGLRGPLGVAIPLSMDSGRLFVNIAGAYALTVAEVDGESFCDWRRLSLCGLALAVGLSAMAGMPESPKWLAKQGRVPEALAASKALRSRVSEAEESELRAALGASRAAEGKLGLASSMSSSSAKSHPSARLADYRRSLIVAVGLICFQQLSGINAIMMYAMDIFVQTGMENAELSCILVMLAQVVLGTLPCLLVEAVGRRPLLQFAGTTMCISHLGLAYYMAARSRTWWAPPSLALASLGTYVLGFAVGMGSVPWIILPELFPVEVVGVASSIATGVGWSFSFIACVGFRALQEALGASGVFMLFAIFCCACFVFVTMLVPETKGKTLEQILCDLKTPARRVDLTTPGQ